MRDNNFNEENYINLEGIFKFIKRNIRLLTGFSAISLIITSLTFLNAKRIWSGQFQIVIEEPANAFGNKGSSTGVESFLFNQISSSSNTLQTEVEILKSPFVLLNVFEFIQRYDPSESNKKESFRDWLNNINVEFTEGTSVLNISYKDTKKTNIIPVLEKISEKYQDYSGSKREKDISSSLKYFKDQIKIYKVQSNLSHKKANDFAQKHDLIALRNNDTNIGIEGVPVLTIESSRTKAANKIRKIDELIEMVNSEKNNPDSILQLSQVVNQALGTTFGKTNETKKIIDNINLKLVSLRTIYSENDESIQDLIRVKKIYAETLLKNTLGVLEAQKESTKADLKSLERPIGVISKYKELLRSAAKDEVILSQLEDQLSFYSLENAKSKDPWLLITNPTLSPFPLPTYKLRKLILTFFVGIILGSIYALVKERFDNKIMSENDVQTIFKDISIDTFLISQKDSWEKKVKLISMGLLEFYKSGLKMLLLDLKDNSEATQITELFNKNNNKLKITTTDSIIKVFEEKEFLLCIKSSISSIDKIKEIKSNLDFQNKKLVKIIFIDE